MSPRQAGDALFGTVDTWLLYHLTGGTVHATDVTNASRTLMMDLATLQWDDQILKDLNIPKQMLPQVPTYLPISRCLPCPHLYIEVPKHLPPPHLLDLRLSCLQIRPSSGLFGHVAASSPTGLGGVPVAGVLGDQQAALFGQGRGYRHAPH